jgi:hypothetical protein
MGHCGTAWLAYALNRPELGVVAWHEARRSLFGYDLDAALLSDQAETEPRFARRYGDYWSFVRRVLAAFPVAVDSNSWAASLIPALSREMGLQRVIYLVRNGIQNVHSVFHHFTGVLDGDQESHWEYWCRSYRKNEHLPSWLTEHLGPEKVSVYRLEDLVSEPAVLLELFARLGAPALPQEHELQAWQHIDANRKVQGSREPEVIWRSWTDQQRRIFQDICGSTMAAYGYRMPGNSAPQPHQPNAGPYALRLPGAAATGLRSFARQEGFGRGWECIWRMMDPARQLQSWRKRLYLSFGGRSFIMQLRSGASLLQFIDGALRFTPMQPSNEVSTPFIRLPRLRDSALRVVRIALRWPDDALASPPLMTAECDGYRSLGLLNPSAATAYFILPPHAKKFRLSFTSGDGRQTLLPCQVSFDVGTVPSESPPGKACARTPSAEP